MTYTPDEAKKTIRRQHGLVTRTQALEAGLSSRQIATRLKNGQWIQVHAGVYRSADHAASSEQSLLAACLGAGPGSAASHMSAAWLLGLWDRAPSRPEISVRYPLHPRVAGVTIIRSRFFDLSRTISRSGIRTTDGLTVLSDLAGKVAISKLTSILDRAIATRLVSVAAIDAHLMRVRAPGRSGLSQLHDLIVTRGLSGGPPPSVLEAESLRLFGRWRVPVIGREVVMGADGRYRIDFLVAEGFAVEVDGYAYHWSPEAKSRDESRRNQLRIGGLFILVYTWRDIHYDAERVALEILSALRSHMDRQEAHE